MNREYLKSRCFEDEDENWWERRTGMERCMFVSLIIAITISVGSITFIILQYLLIQEFCTSTICMSEAITLTARVNESVDPCEDFFKYSCKIVPEVVDLQQKVKQEIDLLIQEPIDENEHSAVKSEKQLFLVCMNETDADNSISVIHEMVGEIGGWPVVVGYRWRARLFEWTDSVYVLRSRGFPFWMFFSVLTKEEKILISNPVESHLGYNRYLYKQFMIDTAVAFGADRYQAQLQMEDVLLFAEELRNITREKIDDKIKTEELFSTELTIDELQKMYDEIQWIDFLNNILYPIVTVTSTDMVVIPSHQYLGTILDLLSATPKRVQANYLVWKVVEQLIPFMSKELQDLKGNYTCQTGGNTKIDRKELCTKFIDSIYYVRPLQIFYLNSHSTSQVDKQIEELIANIKTELVTLLQNSAFDESSIEESAKFINSIQEVIGVPENLLNQSIFEDMILENDENVFKTILEAHKKYIDTIYALNYQLNNTTDLYNLIKSVDVRYSETSNTIVIPNIFVQEFYKEQQPMYLNYANVGVIYAKVLIEALLINAENIWSNSTIQLFKEQPECLGIDEKFITHKVSINLAYTAYTKWAESNAKEPKLVGLSQTPSQLFWISALSNICADFEDTNETDIFLNNRNFINDFKCSDSLTSFNNCDGL